MTIALFKAEVASFPEAELQLFDKAERAIPILARGERLSKSDYERILADGGIHIYRCADAQEAVRNGQVMTAHNNRSRRHDQPVVAYRKVESRFSGWLLLLGVITQSRTAQTPSEDSTPTDEAQGDTQLGDTQGDTPTDEAQGDTQH